MAMGFSLASNSSAISSSSRCALSIARLVLLHVLTQALVAPQISFHGGVDRLLREGRHGQKLVFEFCELLMKVNARHERSPLI